MDISVAAVLILLGLVVLRWAIILAGATLLLEARRSCPACFAATLPVRRPILDRLFLMAMWRWCPTCDWSGPVLKPSVRKGEAAWTTNVER